MRFTIGKHLFILLTALVYVSTHSLQGANSPLSLGLGKQLLVDDLVIESMTNVTREVGVATKQGIVLKPSLPSDFQAGHVHDGPDGGPGYEFGESAFCWFFSPHWDPDYGKFRLWYMAGKRPGSGLAYAESHDGSHWTKPLISSDGKSNLVNWLEPVPVIEDQKSYPLLDLGLDGVTVMIDPTLPIGHPEKYKVALFPNRGGPDCATRLGYSADGINWRFYNNGKPVTGRAADFSNQLIWDPMTQRYLLLCREDFAAGGGVGELRGVRIMAHNRDNNLMDHPTAWETLRKFVLNDPSPAQVPGTNIPQHQIHTFPIWYYEGIYFALTDVLKATNRPVPVGQQEYYDRHEQGIWEFYLSPSRNGVDFDFSLATYPRKALIPRGPNGSFDKDCVRPPMNIITHGDQHYIYYLGTNERWGARKWDARLGLSKLRLDGFFYLQARESIGTVQTKQFTLEGDRFEVNIEAPEGVVRLDVLNSNDEIIASAQAEHIDHLRWTPSWPSMPTLKEHHGSTIRLRFTVRQANLYSFTIQ